MADTGRVQQPAFAPAAQLSHVMRELYARQRVAGEQSYLWVVVAKGLLPQHCHPAEIKSRGCAGLLAPAGIAENIKNQHNLCCPTQVAALAWYW